MPRNGTGLSAAYATAAQRLAADLLRECLGGRRVSAVRVEVVVDLERVDGVLGLQDVDGEDVAVDCLEHGERDLAEALRVPAPFDPRARGDAQHAVALTAAAGASRDR